MAAVRVKFTASRAGINQACRGEGVFENLERRMFRVKSAAIATVNHRTGDYARGLKMERFTRRGRAGVRLVATADHSAVVELGSRPHVIEPRNKQALAWPGGRHPVRRVRHPGTQAQHTLRNALKAAK